MPLNEANAQTICDCIRYCSFIGHKLIIKESAFMSCKARKMDLFSYSVNSLNSLYPPFIVSYSFWDGGIIFCRFGL